VKQKDNVDDNHQNIGIIKENLSHKIQQKQFTWHIPIQQMVTNKFY